MRDGIEIHFDEKNGYLELACEPDAFAPYREIAKRQLAEIPGLPNAGRCAFSESTIGCAASPRRG